MHKPRRWNTERLRDDMEARGWMAPDLARHAGVSAFTVRRWLSEQFQTPRTTAKLALALGYAPRRYMLSSPRVKAVA